MRKHFRVYSLFRLLNLILYFYELYFWKLTARIVKKCVDLIRYSPLEAAILNLLLPAKPEAGKPQRWLATCEILREIRKISPAKSCLFTLNKHVEIKWKPYAWNVV